jgi:hypothetical protein
VRFEAFVQLSTRSNNHKFLQTPIGFTQSDDCSKLCHGLQLGLGGEAVYLINHTLMAVLVLTNTLLRTFLEISGLLSETFPDLPLCIDMTEITTSTHPSPKYGNMTRNTLQLLNTIAVTTQRGPTTVSPCLLCPIVAT